MGIMCKEQDEDQWRSAWQSHTSLVDVIAKELDEVGIYAVGARTRAVQRAACACASVALTPSWSLKLLRPKSCKRNASMLQYRESEDPGKMAISRMALTERGQSLSKPNAKSKVHHGSTVDKVRSDGAMGRESHPRRRCVCSGSPQKVYSTYFRNFQKGCLVTFWHSVTGAGSRCDCRRVWRGTPPG